jgi:hypothetical protein
MAFDFPASPSEGQQYTPPGSAITYVWNSPTWKSIGATRILMSDTAPANPAVGTMWWESDTGNTYIWYQDADGSQWVQQNIVGTPGQDEIWNGQYMKWNTSASLGGLWWTAAGLGIGWKTGPSRFIINSAEDFSGTDVFSVSDAGVVTGNVITSIVTTVITSSGTYTKPAGLKFLDVVAVGAGGAGGAAILNPASASSAGGSGGAGAVGMIFYKAVDLPASFTITVGAEGAATATSGNAGGSTIVNGLAAGGGSGGAITQSNTLAEVAGGSGGTVTGFSLGIPGGAGGNSYVFLAGLNHRGAAPGGPYGEGAASGWGSNISGSNFPSVGYGAGGTGSTSTQLSGGPYYAANGRPGLVILKEYF